MAVTDCLDEERVVALVEGRLGPGEVLKTEEHLRGCADCTDLVTSAAQLASSQAGAPTAASPSGLQPGARFGRYTILALLGQGGMGAVHAAYDPQLDRRVALKVLATSEVEADASAPGVGGEGRHRLLREAKSIAKLSHPNVVAVHDAGEVDGRVFIAMEYIDGQTVDVWLRAGDGPGRPWPEVVATFVHAGRGLAAAHEAAVVHRDFKPQNVMVGKDGRVRVMDFGLATEPLSEATGAPDAGVELAAATATVRLLGLTRTGSLLGTPLYMAPEQFRGEPADERSDQFSFCVALYEGLYGERPFPSSNIGELIKAVLAGRVRERPARTQVPSWLRAIVLKGLAARREDRHPSMAALLERLERNPARRRRWIAGTALVAAGIAAAGMAVSWTHARTARICRQPVDRLAAIWEPPGAPSAPRHEAVRRAFLGSGRSYAATSLATVTRGMDAYAARWTSAYSDACEATHVRKEQSAGLLDLRTRCLDHALGAFKAMAELLGTADAALVNDAVMAVGLLPDLDRCDDPRRLQTNVPLPQQAQAREQVERLRGRMAEVKVLGDAGRSAAALEASRRLVTEARAVDFPPVLGEALVAQAQVVHTSDTKSATAAADEAFWLATRLGQDETAERAAHLLALVNGYDGSKYADADLWAKMAGTLLERLGPGQDLEWAWYWQDVGCIAFREGRVAASRDALEKGLAIKTRVLGAEHPDVGLTRCSLAATCLEVPDYACALKWADEGAPIIERGFGDKHPDLGVCLQNRGEALSGLGRFREAIADHERARAIWAADLGADHPRIGYALNGKGVALLGLGDFDGARKVLEDALALREKLAVDPILIAETRFALARALWGAGERGRAVTLATAAREAYARVPELAPRLRAVDAWLAARRAG